MTRADIARKAGLLLDTNLLVLYVVGQYDPNRIAKHKRTSSYMSEDFDLLLDFMSLFKQFVTTPNILTEVSNLLEKDSYQYGPVLSILPELIKNFVEIPVPSHPVMVNRNKTFLKFGLSDTVACQITEQDYLLLTDDLDLCYYLPHDGLNALNFNNIRSANYIV